MRPGVLLKVPLTVVLAAAVMMGKGCERFPAPTRSVPSPLSAKVFPPNVQHLQENIAIIVEIKKEGTKRDHPDGGIGQMKSNMSACLNAEFAMWTNGKGPFPRMAQTAIR